MALPGPAALRPLLGRPLAALAVAAGVLLLVPGLGDRDLLRPWEARHAEVAAGLAAEGPAAAYAPPHRGGTYLERPAPAYWPAALAQAILGPSPFAARLPAALAALALLAVLAAVIRRARGAPDAALAAGVFLSTPAVLLLFRSALPAALPAALAAGGFLAAALVAARDDPPPAARWGAPLALGLAAALGGLPAVAPPLAALALFRLLRPAPPAAPDPTTTAAPTPGPLRTLLPPLAGLTLAAALVTPAFALHGTSAAWGYLRPDLAEEPARSDEEIARIMDRPEDREGFDREAEAILWGTMPWVLLLPAALFGPLRRRPFPTAEPAGDSSPSEAPADESSLRFDLLVRLWAAAALGQALILGDRWHHDPFAALLPVALLVGLHLGRLVRTPWTRVDTALALAGLALAAVAYRDLEGGRRLVDLAAYFTAESALRPPVLLAWALRIALVALAGAAAFAFARGRFPPWAAALAVAAALAWAALAAHLAVRPEAARPVPAAVKAESDLPRTPAARLTDRRPPTPPAPGSTA